MSSFLRTLRAPQSPGPTAVTVPTASPPSSRKRGRRTSGSFLSRNDFRVLELVVTCPSIVRQTIKECLSMRPNSISSSFQPSGFAVIVSPTRLIVWNAFRPEEAPIALAFEDHDVNVRSSRLVALIYDRPVHQRNLQAIVYAQPKGLVVHITTSGQQSRLSLQLRVDEKVTVIALVTSRLCLIGTSKQRLLQLRISSEGLTSSDIDVDGVVQRGVLGRIVSSFGRTSATNAIPNPYLALACHSPMRGLAMTANVIEEFSASETGHWSIDWSSSAPIQDVAAVCPESSDQRFVDFAVCQQNVAILVSCRVGPLNQLRHCIGMYERKQGGIFPLHHSRLIESFEVDEESARSLQVEMSDQDPSLAFIYGQKTVLMFDLATGVNDCIRFDDPVLLGGGRGRDHRGCFFISATNGIICARLARGPSTAALAFSELTTEGRVNGEGGDSNLFSAFAAFQQARISNCRAMVAALGDVNMNEAAVNVSVRIMDASFSSMSLPDKQSRHAAFNEFLRAVPSADSPLWERLFPETQATIQEHGDAIEIALALHQILHVPAGQFHEVLASSRDAFDTARREFVHNVMSACIAKRDNLMGAGRVEDQFFSQISTLVPSLPEFISHLSNVNGTALLQLVFVCRVMRIIFSLASEAVQRIQSCFALSYWIFDNKTRSMLRSLLNLLRDAVVYQSANPEHLHEGFAYMNYYYVSSVLLNGYILQFTAADNVPGCHALRQELDHAYQSDRLSCSRDMVDLAPAHPDRRHQYALGFEFAERFADFAVLAELCELCSWPERSDAYLREYGDPYATACCSTWYSRRQYDKLMANVGKPWLDTFLTDKPLLSWVLDLDKKDYDNASRKLSTLADDCALESRLRLSFSAMAKLTCLRVSVPNQDDLDRFDNQIALIQSQSVLKRPPTAALTPDEQIALLIQQASQSSDDGRDALVAASRLMRLQYSDAALSLLLSTLLDKDLHSLLTLSALLSVATGTTEHVVQVTAANKSLSYDVIRELASDQLPSVRELIKSFPERLVDAGRVLSTITDYVEIESHRRQ
uniref:Uncharacterized protein n=1 Tax=Spongospora subterranea TaxID=70186 RepID=A0A0H5R7N8_9EUKA|eukprot:CRZ10138.1 hypothetical protein [Spongospora subterranea]